MLQKFPLTQLKTKKELSDLIDPIALLQFILITKNIIEHISSRVESS